MAQRVSARLQLSPARVLRVIHAVRGHRVLLDADIAALYGVSTKAVVQAVKRNRSRFPSDFMFQLTASESADLRSQTVTSRSWGGRRTRPYVFTEQGVAMLSSVLRSARAIHVNIAIMRAFVQLRLAPAAHAELARKLAALERKYDGQFAVVFAAIRQLMGPAAKPRRPIGFSAGLSARF